MPYSMKNPPTFAKNMPKAAQKIAIDTFNAVFAETKDEDKARQAALGNIKDKFKKVGDRWVPKADFLMEVDMTITKATVQPDGGLRWQGVMSDTNPDKMAEATSIPLFQDWINRADNHIETSFLPPPRQPFLGLSHYPDLDGLASAGETEQMYVDGNRFKASGYFYADTEHPLGKALFSAVRKEQELVQKGQTVDKPIRISAAWWDLAHKHGDFLFERKSLSDVCSMCKGGAADKVYLKGQLDHFAATRVPINPNTSLELKAMTTRKEDALSIIDDPELVGEIDKRAKLEGKSEALTIKAKAKAVKKEEEEEEAVDNPEEEETPKAKKSEVDEYKLAEEAHQQKMLEKFGQEFLDQMAEKGPQGMAIANNEGEPNPGYVPLGGATSLQEAMAFIKAHEMLGQSIDRLDVYNTVINNIFQYVADPMEQVKLVKEATKDLNSEVARIKSAVSDAILIEPVEVQQKGEIMTDQNNASPEVEKMEKLDPLRVATDNAYKGLKRAMEMTDEDEKRKMAQKAMKMFARKVENAMTGKGDLDDIEEYVEVAVQRAMGPLAEQLSLINAKLGQPQPQQYATQPPQQKSFTPALVDPSVQKAGGPEMNQLKKLALQKVGLVQQ